MIKINMVEGSAREFKRKGRAMTPSQAKAFLSGRKAGKTLPRKPSPSQRNTVRRRIEDMSAKAGTKKSTERQLFFSALAGSRKGKKKVAKGVQQSQGNQGSKAKEAKKKADTGGGLNPSEFLSYISSLKKDN